MEPLGRSSPPVTGVPDALRMPHPVSAAATARRFTLALALVVLAVELVLYFPTLGASWAYDDMDYLNLAGDVLAGKRPFWNMVFFPQGEHLVMIQRLVVFASLKLFGVDVLAFRLLNLAAHAAAAVFLGLMARRASGSDAAGLATGVTYVGAAGLSSMWVWFPTGAGLTFGIAFLTGAAAALAHRARLGVRRARVLAGLGVVLGLASESTLFPLVALPVLLDEAERRREGARRPIGAFAVFCAVAVVACVGLASFFYRGNYGGSGFSISLRHGIPRAVFLMLVAPFRLLFPGIWTGASDPGLKTAVLGSALGLAVALPAVALLLALWRRGAPRLAAIAAFAAVGPLGIVGLVGLGRWRTSYWEIFDADRYFFTLLIPLSLLAGAVAATASERLRSWPWRPRIALLLLLFLAFGTELALHRRAMLNRIPFHVYDDHERRLDQLSRLADRLETAARTLPPAAPPLEFPDTDFWFPEVHNGRISARLFVYAISDRADGRLRLGGLRVSERDSRILNAVLAAWAQEIGEPGPFLSIVDGRLVDARIAPFVDFRTDAHDAVVVSGFYRWEEASRWMSRRGELRLSLRSRHLAFLLAVPREALAGPQEIAVTVTAVDEESGGSAGLGTIHVRQEGIQRYPLDAKPFLGRMGAGRIVRLVLESDRTWRPDATIPGSLDPRPLSVQVFAAGCE